MSRVWPCLSRGEFGNRHLRHRKYRVRTIEWQHLEPADFGVAEVFRSRFLGAVQQLLAVDDLQHAALVRAVSEVDAVDLRPERDRSVQLRRYRTGGARLLAGQSEVADLHRFGRITEVIDHGHATGAPARHAGDQVGDSGIAFPPVLVGVTQALDAREQGGIGGIGHVPDFVRPSAEDPQHVELGGIAFRQALAVADAHHLRTAVFVVPFQAGDVLEIFRISGIGDVENRRAVEFRLAGQLVHGLGDVGYAAVMTDIGDVALPLLLNRRLIGAALLEIIVSDQPHVHRFRRSTDPLLLCGRRRGQSDRQSDDCSGVANIGYANRTDLSVSFGFSQDCFER